MPVNRGTGYERVPNNGEGLVEEGGWERVDRLSRGTAGNLGVMIFLVVLVALTLIVLPQSLPALIGILLLGVIVLACAVFAVFLKRKPAGYETRSNAEAYDGCAGHVPVRVPAEKATAEGIEGRMPERSRNGMPRKNSGNGRGPGAPSCDSRGQLSRRATVSFAGPGPASSTHPSIAADARRGGGLQLLAVTTLGDGHAAERLPREDAYATYFDGAGTWVLAVADGLSRSPESRFAADALANLAVRQASNPEISWNDAIRRISESAYHEVRGLMDREFSSPWVLGVKGSPTLSEPKSTLSVVRVSLRAGQSAQLEVAAVGNSPVLLLGQGERLEELLELGENPDGSTSALPSSAPKWQTAIAAFGPGDILVLCTDGFERTYVEYRSELLELFNRDVPPAEKLPELIGLMSRDTQGMHDDRTVLVLRFGG